MSLKHQYRLLIRWRWLLLIFALISLAVALLLPPIAYSATQEINLIPANGQQIGEYGMRQVINQTVAYLESDSHFQSFCDYVKYYGETCSEISTTIDVNHQNSTIYIYVDYKDIFFTKSFLNYRVRLLNEHRSELNSQLRDEDQIEVQSLDDVLITLNYSILRCNMLIGLFSSISIASGMILIYENLKQRRQLKRKRKAK